MSLENFKFPESCPICETPIISLTEVLKEQDRIFIEHKKVNWFFKCKLCNNYAIYYDNIYDLDTIEEFIFNPKKYLNDKDYQIIYEEWFSRKTEVEYPEASIFHIFKFSENRLFKMICIHLDCYTRYSVKEEFDYNTFNSYEEIMDFRKKVLLIL